MEESEQSSTSNTIYSSVCTYTPIITKVDAPPEDSKEEATENDQNERKVTSQELKICSPISPAKSDTNMAKNPFSASNSFAKGILKPPQLSVTSSQSKKFILNPSKLNPIANSSGDSGSSSSEKNLANGDAPEAPKFVPLKEGDVVAPQQVPSVSSSGAPSVLSTNTPSSAPSFVFGQNLQDRVIASEGKAEEGPSTSVNSNGTVGTDMLFSSAIKKEGAVEFGVNNGTSKEAKTLSESAREYEESRANKRKYEEVEVKTGEEEETNILAVSCKLFAYDTTGGNWQERGRGTLRLNDFQEENNRTQSRLVFRTSGSLRVILNTKVFAKMTAEKASDKSIRLTALDANGDIKVFLVMASIEDSKRIYNHLITRIEKEMESQKRQKSDNTETTTANVD